MFMELFTYLLLIAIVCYMVFLGYKSLKNNKKRKTPLKTTEVDQTKRSKVGSPRKKTK
jgi:hypothetical protein